MVVDFKQAGWKSYIKQIEQLAAQIVQSGFEVDHVVCLARGGVIPGDIISRILNKPLSITKVSSYSDERAQQDVVKIYPFTGGHDITGNILIVDDLCDSGRTLKEMTSHILNRFYNVKEVRSAVIWFKNKGNDTLFTPDYVVNNIDQNEWQWVIQPFELYENIDTKQLVKEYE